jgi:hypothetical protein
VEVPNYEGRWTRARARRLRELESQPATPENIVAYSRAAGERSLDVLTRDPKDDTPEDRAQRRTAAFRLQFRRWVSENGLDEAFANGSARDQERIIQQWADSVHPPTEQTNRRGEPTGRVRRASAAQELINALVGEGKMPYWTVAVPEDQQIDDAVRARATRNPLARQPADASQPQQQQQQQPSSMWQRARDIGVETIAGFARGAIGLGDFVNRGLQRLGIGADQANVEAVYALLNSGKEYLQSEDFVRESRVFSEALRKVDGSVIMEMGRALARGDTENARRLAEQSGLGEAWDKAGTSVVLATILGGAAEFVAPFGAGARIARAGANVLARGAPRAASGASAAGGVAAAAAAPTATQMTEVGAEVRRETGDNARADAASAIVSAGGAIAGLGNVLGATIGPGGQVARALGLRGANVLSGEAARATTRAAVAGAAGAAQGGLSTAGQNVNRAEAGVEQENVTGPALLGGVLGGVLGAFPTRGRSEAPPAPPVPAAPGTAQAGNGVIRGGVAKAEAQQSAPQPVLALPPPSGNAPESLRRTPEGGLVDRRAAVPGGVVPEDAGVRERNAPFSWNDRRQADPNTIFVPPTRALPAPDPDNPSPRPQVDIIERNAPFNRNDPRQDFPREPGVIYGEPPPRRPALPAPEPGQEPFVAREARPRESVVEQNAPLNPADPRQTDPNTIYLPRYYGSDFTEVPPLRRRLGEMPPEPPPAAPRGREVQPAEQIVADAMSLPRSILTPEERQTLGVDRPRVLTPDGILDVSGDTPKLVRPNTREFITANTEGRLPPAGVSPEVAARIVEQARIRRQVELARDAFVAQQQARGVPRDQAWQNLARAEQDGTFRRFMEQFYSRKGVRPAAFVDTPTAAAVVGEIDGLATRVGAAVEVYDGVRAMPIEYRQAFADGQTKAVTFTDQDGVRRVVVDRSMHADGTDLRKTLQHEIVGHVALPEILGATAYNNLMMQVSRLQAENSAVAQLYREVAKQYPGADPRTQAAEVLARVVEDGSLPKRSGVQKLRDSFLAAMRQAGFRGQKDGLMTGDQLQSLLATVRDSVNNPEAAWRLKEAMAPLGSAGLGQQFDYGTTGIRQTFWTRAASFLWNENAPIIEAARSLRDVRGVSNGIVDQLFQAPNRINTTFDRFAVRHIEPLRKAMQEIADASGKSLDQISVILDQIAAARHGIERNESTWLLFGRVNDMVEGERIALLRDFRSGKIDGATLRANLRAIITDETARTPRAEWRGYGATDAELRTLRQALDADPVARQVEARIWPMLRAFVDDLTDHQLKSGILTRAEIDMYGFSEYVPAKGGAADAPPLIINDVAANYVNTPTATGRKGQGVPERIVGELLDSAVDTARAFGNREFFRALAKALDADAVTAGQGNRPLFGREVDTSNVVSASSGRIKFNIPKNVRPEDYKNVFRYVDDNGDLRYLAITDPNLAAALRHVAEGPPRPSRITSAAQSVTGLQGRLLTSLNPWFWGTQIQRDIIGNTLRMLTDYSSFGLSARDTPTLMSGFLARFAREMLPTSPTWAYASRNADRGAQLRLIDEWKASSDPALRERAEFLESGAIRFSSQFSATSEFRGTPLTNVLLGTDNVARRGYDKLFGSDGTIKTLAERVMAVQEAMELGHRWAFYQTLRRHGVDPDKARAETIQLTNFNQRSRVSRALNPWFAFSHTITAGADRAFNKGLWVNGEVPWRRVEMPDGTVERTISLADIAANLNYRRLGVVAAMGYIAAAGAASVLGEQKDRHGVSLMDKISPEARMRSFFFPGTKMGQVFRVALPDTEATLGLALGVAIHGLETGTMNQAEARVGLLNVVQRIFGPALKPRNDFPDGERGNPITSMLLGAVPTAMRPIAEGALNYNFAGNPLDRRGQVVSGPGGQTRLAGVEATRDTTNPFWRRFAEAIRGATGGVGQGVDISGEVYRNIITTYLGPPARVWDGVAQAEHQARREGRANEFNPVEKIIRDLFIKEENSFKTYYFREHEQARAPLEAMRRAYFAAIQADRDAGEARIINAPDSAGRTRKAWSVGPRQQAFLDANPVMRDYEAYLRRRMSEDRREQAQVGASRYQRARTARQAGDAEQIRAETERAEDRLASEIRLFKGLWRAHTEWQTQGSNPDRWDAIRDQALPPARMP